MPVNLPKGKLSVIILDVFNETVIPVIKEEAKALADEFCQTLKDNIRTRDLKSRNLSPRTLKNKKYKDQSSTPLIATGEYLDSIQVLETKEGYTVGVADETHSNSKNSKEKGADPLPMRDLARMLEFGTSKMAPIPHWRPTWSAFLRKKELTKKYISKKAKEAAMKKMAKFNKERFRK